MLTTFDELRRFTVARNFPAPTTLKRALHRMGFLQADPIRAPARAQDLILRQRVKNYRAGDIERRYATLGIAEDVFVNYGFVSTDLQCLMHPRSDFRIPAGEVNRTWPAAQRKKAQLVLDFVRECGSAHPREVDEHFAHGKVTNYWGGSSNASTHLLEAMHYRGLLSVARREKGIRIYTPSAHAAANLSVPERWARMDALVDVVVGIYAPLPGASLSYYVRRLQYAAPQWRKDVRSAFERAKQRLASARIAGVDWYWPAEESPARLITKPAPDVVRLLAPFDPVVHDRSRFELLWGWAYRFEAYTPAAKRKLGYYALPLLWRDRVIGWANLAVERGELKFDFGFVSGVPPRERAFTRELEAEVDRVRVFLGLKT
ncbi:MAG TPA: crosslink repair DNA glycosylase YcaQ family protein [Pyrinomonadaceae bacterium]|jgi:uncharacterized protein YcaQ|nr:crosslink repair DNA glycosylase YcaQ family protein [Pyrinomonadaceae bacterium]